MIITSDVVEQFKKRMRIYHDTEDDSLADILESSFIVVKNLCGEFDMKNPEGRELVFERARYVYWDSVEFFEENFQKRIHSFGYTLAFEEVGDSSD